MDPDDNPDDNPDDGVDVEQVISDEENNISEEHGSIED